MWGSSISGLSALSLSLRQNVDILKDPETVKQLGSILKTNVRACKAVGHPFVIQLGRIYLDMLNVYKCLSENISAAIQTNGGCERAYSSSYVCKNNFTAKVIW